MIYIITNGKYSDYGMVEVIEGPADYNLDALGEEVGSIHGQLETVYRAKRDEWRAKYPEDASESIGAHWPKEAREAWPGYPTLSEAVRGWLATHPEFHIIEWDEVNLYL
mgnify:CR=1 FL=1